MPSLSPVSYPVIVGITPIIPSVTLTAAVCVLVFASASSTTPAPDNCTSPVSSTPIVAASVTTTTASSAVSPVVNPAPAAFAPPVVNRLNVKSPAANVASSTDSEKVTSTLSTATVFALITAGPAMSTVAVGPSLGIRLSAMSVSVPWVYVRPGVWPVPIVPSVKVMYISLSSAVSPLVVDENASPATPAISKSAAVTELSFTVSLKDMCTASMYPSISRSKVSLFVITSGTWSFKVIAPVVSVARAALPAASYIEAPSKGFISTVSTPLAAPVMLRLTLITLSPPARAPPPVSVTLEMLAPVAFPPFWMNTTVKSVVSKAPLPPLVLYSPSMKVTSI